MTINNNINNITNKDNTNNILSKQSTIGEGEYKIEDFNYLIGREHVDPDNGLVYTTIGIRKHGRFIAADRRLSAAPSGRIEAIHALDVVSYAEPAPPACSSAAAVSVRARMGQSEPAPCVRPPGPAVRVTAREPKPGPDSTSSSRQRVSTISAETTPGTPKMSRSPNAPIIYTADSGPPWSTSRNIPPRLSDKRDLYNRSTADRPKRPKTDYNFQYFATNLTPNPYNLNISDIVIPANSRQKENSPQVDLWTESEVSEISSLEDAGCLVESDLPPGFIAIDSKFVRTAKSDYEGWVQKFKSRLTGRGDQMEEGVDFVQSYSAVVSWLGIRLFLAITVLLKLIPLQLDCELAYINAPLEEEVYMNPPKGRELPNGKVWRVMRSLYGLKQSGRNWNKLLDSVLKGLGFNFHSLEEDVCLYVRNIEGVITIMFLYVDDIYIAASNQPTIDEFVKNLGDRFKIKVLGKPSQLLGVNLRWGEDYSSVHMSIAKLIKSLLLKFSDCEIVERSTPMRHDLKLMKSDLPDEEARREKSLIIMQKRYRTLVGTFIFIATTCRPDISFATMMLCRSTSNPGWKHWEAALHLLGYLKRTMERGIQFNTGLNLLPFLYADAVDGSDETRKTIAGFMMIVAGAPILWKATLITAYSFSTCESEIRAVDAAFMATKVAAQIRKIYDELSYQGVINTFGITRIKIILSRPLLILEDNKATILWAEANTGSSKLKHLERELYWIRDARARGKIEFQHCGTKDQCGDIFTKALQYGPFENLAQRFMCYFAQKR